MNNTILILGGTGIIGRGVVAQLLADGYAVRILTRDGQKARAIFMQPELTIIEGDMTDPDCLNHALAGADAVHISLPSGHDRALLEKIQYGVTAQVAKYAPHHNIGHISYVSGYLVAEQFLYIPAERAKHRAEHALMTSGVGYTIFRPTYFTDLLPNFIQGKRGNVFGKQPHPIRFLTIADFAKQVSVAHRSAPTNRAYFVCGPEAIPFADALRIIAPDATIGHAPFWMMGMMNRLFLKGELTEILDLMRVTERVGELGYDPDEANNLFGTPSTTVRAWRDTTPN